MYENTWRSDSNGYPHLFDHVLPEYNTAGLIRHIEGRPKENNLNLNTAKSREIIFARTCERCQKVIYPPVIADIPRVEKLTVRGVVDTAKLTASDHVTEVINACSRNLYALKMLQTHGLTGQSLHHVFTAAIQSKLLYCAPCSFDMFIRRSKRYGYCFADTLPVSEFCLRSKVISTSGFHFRYRGRQCGLSMSACI